MRFVCLADLHGYFPVVPPCDVLLVAGDICPTDDERPETQRRWLGSTFARWLADVPAEVVVGVAGNHDFVGEVDPGALRDLDWHYLQDETARSAACLLRLAVDVALPGMGVHADEEELASAGALSPKRWTCCAFLAPLGYGDWISGHNRLAARCSSDRRARPRLCVFGHVHQGYGRWQRGAPRSSTPRYCGMDYLPAHEPVVVGHSGLVGPSASAEPRDLGPPLRDSAAPPAAGAWPVTAVRKGSFSSA